MENLSATKQEFGNMTKVILITEMVLEGTDRIEPVGSSSQCSHAYCIMLVP